MKFLPSHRPATSSHYPWVVVGLLVLTSMLSFMDRQIVSLLVAPIRAQFQIGDAQMGLLMGGVFALAYSLAGVPLSYIADRSHRRNLIVAGVLFWSLATISMALARSFGDLLLARAALAVGEAALAPAAYSLIAAYFPPQQAARAASVYALGVYLGVGMAVAVGGVLLHLVSGQAVGVVPGLGAVQPWQAALLVLGLIGPILALVLLLGLREPTRLLRPAPVAAAEWGLLKGRWSTLVPMAIGFALLGLSGYASSAWLPSYFVRTHHWPVASFGFVYGAIVMLFGSAGALFGGWLTDRWSAAGRRDAALRVGLISALGSTLFGLWFLLPVDSRLAVALLAPSSFLLAMVGGVWAAALRQLVPISLLGRTTALCLMLNTLAGLGLGPTLVGWLSHTLSGGAGSLALPLLIVCGGAQGLAALALWIARPGYLALRPDSP